MKNSSIEIWSEILFLCLNHKLKIYVGVFSKLNHFQPMFHFYTPWKQQKFSGFLVFLEGMEVKFWLKMSQIMAKSC